MIYHSTQSDDYLWYLIQRGKQKNIYKKRILWSEQNLLAAVNCKSLESISRRKLELNYDINFFDRLLYPEKKSFKNYNVFETIDHFVHIYYKNGKIYFHQSQARCPMLKSVLW